MRDEWYRAWRARELRMSAREVERARRVDRLIGVAAIVGIAVILAPMFV